MTSASLDRERSTLAFGPLDGRSRQADIETILDLASSVTPRLLGGTPIQPPSAWLPDSRYADPAMRVALLEVLDKASRPAFEPLIWEKSSASPPAALPPAPGLSDTDGEPVPLDSPTGVLLTGAFQSVSANLIAKYRDRPERLAEMPWRAFEELVAELFRRDGFDVELTPPSADNGVDIRAARNTQLGTLLYVVECKRHRRDRPIGPKLVRELRGVIDSEKANVGVLVTTSYFTDAALQAQESLTHRMSLRDYTDIVGWLGGAPIF